MVKVDICLSGASKQNALFWKNLPQKTRTYLKLKYKTRIYCLE